MSTPLLTSADVSRHLGLTQQTVLTHAISGKLKGSMIGRRWRFRKEDVDQFVTDQRKGSNA